MHFTGTTLVSGARLMHGTFLSACQVCKDVRSDIESSSEEEADVSRAGTTARAAPISSTRASPGTLLSPKGENGTNGHCTCSKDLGASTEPQQRLWTP